MNDKNQNIRISGGSTVIIVAQIMENGEGE